MAVEKGPSKFLLDSHVPLWSIDTSKKAREAILDESNELSASVAPVWEITVKRQAGKLQLPAEPGFLEEHLRQLGIRSFLPLTLAHVRQVGLLPPIHKDPFDRILVAQAMAERLTVVSKDRVLNEYPVTVLRQGGF